MARHLGGEKASRIAFTDKIFGTDTSLLFESFCLDSDNLRTEGLGYDIKMSPEIRYVQRSNASVFVDLLAAYR